MARHAEESQDDLQGIKTVNVFYQVVCMLHFGLMHILSYLSYLILSYLILYIIFAYLGVIVACSVALTDAFPKLLCKRFNGDRRYGLEFTRAVILQI